MTQHTEIVEKQKEILANEQLDKSIKFIEVKFDEGKWTTHTTGYDSGRVVTQFNDKRKKEIVEYGL